MSWRRSILPLSNALRSPAIVCFIADPPGKVRRNLDSRSDGIVCLIRFVWDMFLVAQASACGG
jgi:hypothetical protein